MRAKYLLWILLPTLWVLFARYCGLNWLMLTINQWFVGLPIGQQILWFNGIFFAPFAIVSLVMLVMKKPGDEEAPYGRDSKTGEPIKSIPEILEDEETP